MSSFSIVLELVLCFCLKDHFSNTHSITSYKEANLLFFASSFSTIYFLLQVKQLLSHFLLNPQHGILVKGLLQDFEGSRPRLMCIRVVEIIYFPSPCMLCKKSQASEGASTTSLLLQELVSGILLCFDGFISTAPLLIKLRLRFIVDSC